VVGTRRPTAYGKRITEKFTGDLVQHGLTIISGLAYGVDTIAHSSCVKSGGKTVAVLGSGIDWIYPSSNKGLARDIIESDGLIITEFPPGTKPDASNFPERNRIVSGLSLGVLVIETGIKGGSMITARLALDQNREVFVVPHPLDNENGSGCNALIKKGTGKLVQDIGDLLVEFPALQFEENEPVKSKPNWKDMELSGQEAAVCRLLEKGELHIDKICEYLGKSSHELMGDLLELEMLDCIEQSAGKYFRIK
jgi:DNA processing protein